MISLVFMGPTVEWLTSAEIAKRLRISRNRLLELIEAGVLVPGQHFIMPSRARLFDPERTEEALREMTRLRCSPQIGETYADEAA